MEDEPQLRVWHPDIVERVASFMSANEIACTLRLVNKAAADLFTTYRTIKLSLPVPSHALRQHFGTTVLMRSMTFGQRCKFVRLIVMSGDLPNLEFALEAAGVTLSATGWALEAAATAGHVEVCIWLRQRYCPWGTCLDAAARAGHQAVCAWLLNNGCPWTVSAVTAAGQGGHAGLVDWLWEQRPDRDGDGSPHDALALLQGVVEGCDLAAVQRLASDTAAARELLFHLQRGQPLVHRDDEWEPLHPDLAKGVLLSAVGRSPTPDWRTKVLWLELGQGWRSVEVAWTRPSGSYSQTDDALDRLLWLRSRGHRVSNDTLTAAAVAADDSEGLRKLVEEMRLPMRTDAACLMAAERGCLAALQYLVEHRGARLNSECAVIAFRGGHVKVLDYLRTRGAFRLDTEELKEAVQEALQSQQQPEPNMAPVLGVSSIDREVVAWAVDELTVEAVIRCGLREAAAAVGDVATLAFLRARGCPWSELTFTAAVMGGHEETLACLLEDECPVEPRPRTFLPAARHGDLGTLRACFQRLRCPWNKRATFLAFAADSFCGLPVLQWLLKDPGCPVNWGDAVRVATAGRKGSGEDNGGVLAWLERHWLDEDEDEDF
ncbi:hypothetical protein PLESTB_001957600 [Pleodorina starrii]|uniref:Ankyrin repeat domain-containing protein n=1 Tax=Pleodorina starrii TaxID=330485 RepID=A0A9W6C2R4_9CHLO|nr:hypothetical protein PLESTM_000935100 [Pleodorina starrii]GLC62904.1 hypothetical protein PLESTB_001957600 [Pleodorina starrii]GLC77194.1 hypothetical protein PLESTF_001896800 [Pleodorina starrii]